MQAIIIERYARAIPTDKIDIDPKNVRKTKQKTGLEDLKNSITNYGLIQPVIVTQKGDRYKLIVGQRRLLAFKDLKKKQIPALIIKPLTGNLKTIVSYGENSFRRALPYEDTVEAVNELFDSYTGAKTKKIKKIHEDLGISTSTVAEYLGHKLVPPEVRKLVTDGKLTRELAYRITAANYPDVKKITSIANDTIRLTKAEKERVKDYEAKNPNAPIENVFEYAKNPPPQVELVIYIEPSLSKRLEKVSERKHTDVGSVVTEAITRYLAEEE